MLRTHLEDHPRDSFSVLRRTNVCAITIVVGQVWGGGAAGAKAGWPPDEVP